MMPPWRDTPLKLVCNCVLASSVRKVGKAMIACASDMSSKSALFTIKANKSKTRIGSVPSNLLLVGLIDREPACGGPVVQESN